MRVEDGIDYDDDDDDDNDDVCSVSVRGRRRAVGRTTRMTRPRKKRRAETNAGRIWCLL